MQGRNNLYRRIILAIILVCLILVGFATFLYINRKTTVERNSIYLSNAATQTTKRIDDLLVSAQNSINAIAKMYEHIHSPEKVDVSILDDLTESTIFDFIGYVNTNGLYTDNLGRQTDVSDRKYFKDGMAGNSGMDMIFNGRVSGEDLTIFYSPVHSGDEVVGVLTGRYKQQQMRNILSSYYFGEAASTYLCLADGTVLACSTDSRPNNIIETLNQNKDADKNATTILTKALAEGTTISFPFSNSRGLSSAFVTKLPHCEWRLFQVFPMQATNKMLDEAECNATILLLWLVLLATGYILIILVESHKDKQKLSAEKQQMKEIVESSSALFSQFIIVDFKQDTYSILSDDEKKIEPNYGSFSDFCNLWENRIIEDNNISLSTEYIQNNLRKDIPYLQYEVKIREDKIYWKQISIICLKRENDIPTSVLLTIQDVTELKEVEQRSRNALENAYKSSQAANEAKRIFLFDMSHDMRTPMNAIIGISELIDRDAEDPKKVRSYSRKINNSGKHLLSLINEVLEMSKLESGNTSLTLASFSLSSLVEELNAIYKPMAQEKSQSFEIRVYGVEQERLIGDKLRLCDIFDNLLSNAIKYTPNGGKISMVVHNLEPVTQGYVRLLFEVSDTGFGISPEFKEKIFEPFTRENNTTASNIYGAGLGLTIAKNLVELMGGTISVDSTPNKGSIFKVILELRPDEKNLNLNFWKDNNISRVLVLGCDEKITKSIQTLLLGANIETEESAGILPNGSYDLILLDYNIPNISTLETIKMLRNKYGKDCIVLLIDNDWIAIEEEAIKAGVNGFLPAPFSLETLRNKITECNKSVKDGKISLEGIRLLVAEDNDINAEILIELLDMNGLICERAVNGHEALDIFKNSKEGYFDAILMDIQMPEMNGYDASKSIRWLNRDDAKKIPIIAMSANSFSDDVQSSLSSGINEHLSKPIDLHQLLTTLEKYLCS